MIKIIKMADAKKEDILTRDINTKSGVEDIVSDIIDNVKNNGDNILRLRNQSGAVIFLVKYKKGKTNDNQAKKQRQRFSA